MTDATIRYLTLRARVDGIAEAAQAIQPSIGASSAAFRAVVAALNVARNDAHDAWLAMTADERASCDARDRRLYREAAGQGDCGWRPPGSTRPRHPARQRGGG